MKKYLEKREAIILRKSGWSYNEIRKQIKVSKSTLSLWLRSAHLAKKRFQALTEKKKFAQRKAIQIIRENRIAKTAFIRNNAASAIGSLSERERWLIGASLHWAEGSKEKDHGVRVQFSNSDPSMILFFREWILDFLNVNPSDIIYWLYIHKNSDNIARAMNFWVSILRIDPCEIKVVLKSHNPSPKRKNTGGDYKGLIRLVVRKSTDMNRKIRGWIDGIIKNTQIIGE